MDERRATEDNGSEYYVDFIFRGAISIGRTMCLLLDHFFVTVVSIIGSRNLVGSRLKVEAE